MCSLPLFLFLRKDKKMKMRKWTCEAIIVAVLLCMGGGRWWFVATKNERQADAQYEQYVKFAKRQAIEITIIKQAAELNRLRTAVAEAQKPKPDTE